jgi:hypothetical protein
MSDQPVQPTVQINATTSETGLVATFQQAGPNGLAPIQQRQTLDVNVSIDNVTAISVTRTSEALRARLKEAQSVLRERQAEASKLSESVEQSFVNWFKSATEDARYASVASALAAFEPGTTAFEFNESNIVRDWQRGRATGTLVWRFSTGSRKSDATISRVVDQEIPADVRSTYNDYRNAVKLQQEAEATIASIRKVLANPSQIEAQARAKVAEAVLKRSGQQELVDSLQNSTVSDDFLDGLIDATR